MKRVTSFAVDIEEVLGGDFDQPILELDTYCPKIVTTHARHPRNNWSRKQCELRVKLSSPCTFGCEIGVDIREELNKKGEPYLEDQYGISMMIREDKEQLKNKGTKGKHVNKRKAIDGWGNPKLVQRNVMLVTDVLNNKTVKSAGNFYDMTTSRVRQIVASYCRMANKKICDQAEDRQVSMDYYRLHKNEFIKNFPQEDSR